MLIIFVYKEVLKLLRRYLLLLSAVINKVIKPGKDTLKSNLNFIFQFLKSISNKGTYFKVI